METPQPKPFSREFFQALVKQYEDSKVEKALSYARQHCMANAKIGLTSCTIYCRNHEWWLSKAQVEELVSKLREEFIGVDIELMESTDPKFIYEYVRLTW